MTLDIARAVTDKICYIILPEQASEEQKSWMEKTAAKYGVSIAIMSGMDWNDALTPWSSDKVVTKGKSHGGHAESFLQSLVLDYFPDVEFSLSIKHPQRYLVGLSMSGLFVVWASFKSDLFAGVASISGSMWYDEFADWVCKHTPSASVQKIYISLGDKEKKSKDKKFAGVEEATVKIVESLRASGSMVEYSLEKDTTHFSPVVPRLNEAFRSLFDNPA